MVDLSVNFAGVKMKNPVILASATPGWDGEHLKKAALAGAGGVVPKSIGPPGVWSQHPRCGRLSIIRTGKTPIGMVNVELYTTKSREEWLTKDLKIAFEGGCAIIASIVAQPDPDETARLAREVSDSGFVHMIELNVSCPMPVKDVGFRMGSNPDITHIQTKAVRSQTTLPILVKLTPNISDMVPVVKAAEEAGADAFAISNSIRSFAGIDIETGKPYLPAFGGYTGPAIKPIIQRFVAEVAMNTKLPISAIGGISTWRDIVEFIMLGATTVQTCTAIMWRGYKQFQTLIKGLEEFMERKGYSTIDDFRGITLPYITTIENYAKNPPKVAHVDRNLCNDCKVCLPICFYDAISFEPNMKVNESLCDGCGLCVELCPKGALSLKEVSNG